MDLTPLKCSLRIIRGRPQGHENLAFLQRFACRGRFE